MLEERFEIPFHSSLHRPLLFLGGERKPVIALGLLVVVLIFDSMSWWGFGLGIVFWLCGSWGLSRMAVSDPQMYETWIRSVRFRKFYRARATPFGALRVWK